MIGSSSALLLLVFLQSRVVAASEVTTGPQSVDGSDTSQLQNGSLPVSLNQAVGVGPIRTGSELGSIADMAGAENGSLLRNASQDITVLQRLPGGCDLCQGTTRTLLTVGGFGACVAKCNGLEAGRGKSVLCNGLCNLVVHVGCAKYGLNCARGMCRAAGKCSGPARLLSDAAGSELGSTADVDSTENGSLLLNASRDITMEESEPDKCDHCQGTTRSLLTVGTFGGCVAKCNGLEPGHGKIVFCNGLCNLVVHVGCAKYGLNCARGMCRAAGKCSGLARLLSEAAGSGSEGADGRDL